ncbi:amino acid ABC transporter substrate-binding protein [Fusobacterium hominis]|uniref:amino acid ABC transporter substrate-binding protein n=1 Tax=Fusobacterium hominis TaxID=2764326 RepID=UPI0022E166DA|nr:amino acid ABC transporter substrate-binding protein [Fusobacterium hominis]
MKKILSVVLLIMGILSTVVFGKDNSLEKIKEKGYFTVGLDATFAPMGYRDENGQIVGFDVDLAKEVAKRIGVEVKFKPCEWDGIIFDLRSGNIDMVWNGMTVTPSRAKQVLFSQPYLANDQVIFTRKDQGTYTIDDLSGKVVGVQLGSSGAMAVENSKVKNDIKDVKKYSTNVEALMDLEAGRLDAVVMDEVSGNYYNQKKSTLNSSVEQLSKEEFAVALRKNDNSLTDEINKQLADMKIDGTYEQIKIKWFGK